MRQFPRQCFELENDCNQNLRMYVSKKIPCLSERDNLKKGIELLYFFYLKQQQRLFSFQNLNLRLGDWRKDKSHLNHWLLITALSLD